jgi:hypothetical protein
MDRISSGLLKRARSSKGAKRDTPDSFDIITKVAKRLEVTTELKLSDDFLCPSDIADPALDDQLRVLATESYIKVDSSATGSREPSRRFRGALIFHAFMESKTDFNFDNVDATMGDQFDTNEKVEKRVNEYVNYMTYAMMLYLAKPDANVILGNFTEKFKETNEKIAKELGLKSMIDSDIKYVYSFFEKANTYQMLRELLEKVNQLHPWFEAILLRAEKLPGFIAMILLALSLYSALRTLRSVPFNELELVTDAVVAVIGDPLTFFHCHPDYRTTNDKFCLSNVKNLFSWAKWVLTAANKLGTFRHYKGSSPSGILVSEDSVKSDVKQYIEDNNVAPGTYKPEIPRLIDDYSKTVEGLLT